MVTTQTDEWRFISCNVNCMFNISHQTTNTLLLFSYVHGMTAIMFIYSFIPALSWCKIHFKVSVDAMLKMKKKNRLLPLSVLSAEDRLRKQYK